MPREPGSGRQQEVYQFIKLNPGTHLREIQRRLSVSSMGNLEYHIVTLQKLKLVVENTEGGYKRYYPTHGAVLNKKLLALLRQKNPRRIALLILENMRKSGCLDIDYGNEIAVDGGDPGGDGDDGVDTEELEESNHDQTAQIHDPTRGTPPTPHPAPLNPSAPFPPSKNDVEKCGLTPFDLMGELGLKPSALSYYLSKMRKQEVLRKEKIGKNVFYVLVKPEEVLQTLISYRESFMDRLVNSFMEGWGL
jgi:hypothetical protein